MSFLFKNLVIMRSKTFSKIFAKTKSREIERRSSRDFGLDIFEIGITQASLKETGKIFCLKHLLNSLVNRGAKMHFESFANLGGISSDPGAESDLTLSMQEMTSSSHIS